jgi:spore maturation protein B
MDFQANFKLVADTVALWTIPVIFLLIIGFAMVKKVKVYESFIKGGKEGWDIFLQILPYIIAILIAIGMFRQCGALDVLKNWISDGLALMGVSAEMMPPETVPVALMRPLSGSGSLGIVAEILAKDPNSFTATVASAMFGSTDTTFYVVALYFGSVGIRKIRHALIAGLLADIAGIITAVTICNILFR